MELPLYELNAESLWLGGIHHCLGKTSCQVVVFGNLFRRQEGDFIKSHWAFTKIAYNLIFPETSPRYFVCGSKLLEFKFHRGCRNGC